MELIPNSARRVGQAVLATLVQAVRRWSLAETDLPGGGRTVTYWYRGEARLIVIPAAGRPPGPILETVTGGSGADLYDVVMRFVLPSGEICPGLTPEALGESRVVLGFLDGSVSTVLGQSQIRIDRRE